MAVEIQLPQSTINPDAVREDVAPVSFQVAAGLLRGLNREQRAAVTHGEGPLVVIAGPGTGKTEVVTRRVAWLIATKRARPREILALTFTDNSSDEMQGRVDFLVPYGQADAAIHTFHAFGDRLLREFAFELGLPGDVRLVNRSEAIVLLREHLFELGLESYRPLGDPTRFLGALVDLFHRAKDEDVAVDRLLEHARGLPSEDPAQIEVARNRRELATAYGRYQALLAERGLIDHGDQVSLPLRLLRESPYVRQTVVSRFRYLLVDEFQDMNPSQLALIEQLTAGARNVTVVGDPAQAIYTFRGATTDNMARFVEHQPGLRQIVLRRNYRSRQPIIDAAQRLIGHSRDAAEPASRQVAHRRGRSSPVRSVWFRTPEQEADGVAAAIAHAVSGGARPGDFAVLTRSNGEVEPLARALRMREIPVRTQLPSDFFAQPSVRPLLAYLRVLADPENTLELYALASAWPYQLAGEELTLLLGQARRRHASLWQALNGALDAKTAWSGTLRESAGRLVAAVRAGVEQAAERSSTEVLYHYLRNSGRLARLARSDDPAEPRAVARFFDIVRDRARLLTHDRVPLLVPHLDVLIEAADQLSEDGPHDADAVSVLTVHRAKGLEFDVVYLTGLTDGRFPARGRPAAIELPWAEVRGAPVLETDRLDEERRLCFVAMTRARNELWLTHHVAGPGGRGRRRVSPFVAEALDAPSTLTPIALDPIGHIAAFANPPTAPELPAEPGGSATDFSFSELETYLDCPERYRLRHVVGLPSAPHHSLTYGSAMHQAVAAFHLAAKRGMVLSDEELVDVFKRAWSPEGFLSREHEDARFAQGKAALLRFRQAQLTEPAPVAAIELPFVLHLDELSIRGRMDRVDRTADGEAIVDYKSSDVRDQAKADQKARDSLQLQIYSMAHEAGSGRLPQQVSLHFLDSGVVGSAVPDPARLERARAKIRAAAEGMGQGRFEPRPNAVTCAYCPFRQICPSSAA